jgi:hypothetical protein
MKRLSISKTSLCQQGDAGQGQQEAQVFRASLLKEPTVQHTRYGISHRQAHVEAGPESRKIMLGGRQKGGKKGLNKANRSHEINDLT